MGDAGGAEPLMVQALEQVPDDPTLLEHYADILAALGRNSEAVESYRKAMVAGGPPFLLKDKIHTQSRPVGQK